MPSRLWRDNQVASWVLESLFYDAKPFALKAEQLKAMVKETLVTEKFSLWALDAILLSVKRKSENTLQCLGAEKVILAFYGIYQTVHEHVDTRKRGNLQNVLTQMIKVIPNMPCSVADLSWKKEMMSFHHS